MGNAPFNNRLGGRVVAQGLENVVFDYCDYVVKEVNTKSGLAFGIPELTEFLSSMEHLVNIRNDHLLLKSVFGEQLIDTLFVRGHSRDGTTPTNYIVQRYVKGKPLTEYLEDPNGSCIALTKKFLFRTREELLALHWKAKRVIALHGIPMDLKFDNIFVVERQDCSRDALYIVDTGFITEARLLFFDNYLPNLVSTRTRFRFLQVCLNRIAQLENVFTFIDTSSAELNQIAKLYGHLDMVAYKKNKERLQEQLNIFGDLLQKQADTKTP